MRWVTVRVGSGRRCSVQRCLTGCVQTLDFFRACQHLSACTERIFGEGTSEGRSAYERGRDQLARQGWDLPVGECVIGR